jgi:pimeloyl-ACP methyl ester carboxylesterase
VFAKRYGQGERIFFGLHGWSGDHTSFAPLARFVPKDATLITVDLPGCGQSPSLPRAFEMREVAHLIATEIAQLNASAITLVGNCSGALLGLSALQFQPQLNALITRLVLIDPFAYAPWYFKIFVAPPIGHYAYLTTFANPAGRWLTNLSLKKKRAAESDLTNGFGRVDHAISYRYLQLFTAIDGIEQWRGVAQPVDIVYGARSFAAIKKSLTMWQQLWPQARLHKLAGAGHLPIQEAPEALSRIIFYEDAAVQSRKQ